MVVDGPMTKKLLYRPREAAEVLGVARSTLYVLLAKQELPSIRLGGCLRIPADALRQWIAARVTGGRA